MTVKTADYPSLHDKVVVVTGGATGIGEALVRGFAAVKAKVAFIDIQDDAAAQLADSIAATGAAKPLYLHVDVTDIAAVEAAFETVRSKLGPVSVLVNNAARDDRQPIDEVTPESFDASLKVNMRHVFFASRAAAKQMQQLGAGSIINFTSGSWLTGIVDLQAYSSAKAAIVGLTNSFARQYGSDGIRVNAVSPGFTVTERQRKLWDNPETIAKMVGEQCIKQRLEPADIAGLVLFLAADDSRMITKQCLYVNGGRR